MTQPGAVFSLKVLQKTVSCELGRKHLKKRAEFEAVSDEACDEGAKPGPDSYPRIWTPQFLRGLLRRCSCGGVMAEEWPSVIVNVNSY